MEPEFIDTVPALEHFLSQLHHSTTGPPSLYIDLEGNDLCRDGTLSLLTVLVIPRDTVHIVDVTTLGKAAFTTAGSSQTLKSTLESDDIIKVFFDIRNDSDALYSHFGVRVAGIQDIQLMELATRTGNRRCVNGLARCIESNSSMGYGEKRDWKTTKDRGRRLFAPEKGGSYAVFDQRPLSAEIIEYCAQDVRHMPDLRKVYREKLCDAWWLKIEEQTLARIRLSQSSNYNGKGRHMALGPVHWQSWSPAFADRASRTRLEEEEATLAAPVAEPSHNAESIETVRPSPSGASQGEPSSIAGALERMMQNAQTDGAKDDRQSDPEEVFGYGPLGFSSSRSYSDEDDDFFRDLTACDKECGYCGQCPY